MEFKHEPEEYFKNLEEYMELDEAAFSPEQSKEEIIAKLKEISGKKKEISDIQNEIIYEYIERFEKGVEALDEEAVDKLRTLMNSLFALEQQQCYDAPVAIRLARILYDYFKEKDNLERIANIIFLGSFSEVVMNISLEIFSFLSFPKLAEEYFPRMNEMSPQAQDALINGYFYHIFTKNDEELMQLVDVYPKMDKRLTDYIESGEHPEKFKSMPMKLHLNFLSLISVMIKSDAEKKKHGEPLLYNFDLEKNRPLLEECLGKLEREAETVQLDAYTQNLTVIQILLSSFHLGKIDFEELVKGLEPYRFTEEEDPISQIMMLTANMTYLNYLYAFSPYSLEEDDRLGRECIQKVLPKILEMKKQKTLMYASYIVNFLGATSYYSLDFHDFYDIALEFTVYSDKALYVHTVMVKEISHLILERILEERTELIEGVNGWNIDYIKSHKDKVLKLMDICAMCHDIGKHYIIEVVSNSSRHLTNDEFGMIKNHPQYFEEFYQKPEEEKERITCIHDCAVLHHRWHNGKGGYPNLPHTVNRPFVDILAIADSLDAATDYIGRPYGGGKSLDELLNEFMEMGGTRYSKEVAEIINEPDIKAAVADVITNRREEVNYRIYAFHEIEGKQ